MYERIIYTKRYPSDDDIEEAFQNEPATLTPEEKIKFKTILQKVAEEYEHKSVFVEIKKKRKGRKQFISLAKTLSRRYKIDADIIQNQHAITVNLYLCWRYYNHFAAVLFAELFKMCDFCSSFNLPAESNHFTLSFDYITHDHYVAGKKIRYK